MSIMSFFVETRWGGSETAPSIGRMRQILKELAQKDPEHPDVWLTHESGWTLSVSETGLVVWDNLEANDNKPRHMVGVDRERALWMWIQLSRGDLGSIEKLSWAPGQSPPIDSKERERLIEEAARHTLAWHRSFYEGLGAERADQPCKHAGCHRGTIEQSLLCRVHHFENVMRCSCPFSD
jgi:hypothetical protein